MDASAPGLVSGEGVRLALSPAGVGSRVMAAALDALIQVVGIVLLILLDIAVAGDADTAAIQALLTIEIVLVLAGYPVVAEWVSKGRTIGKMVFGLRAVRDDGGPIGFRQALVRGIAGLVLEKPGLLFPLTTLAGLITMSTSAREKRLGDMLAGTVVLNERSAPHVLAPPPTWVPPPLQPWALSLDLHRLDDRLALSARQFVSRAHQMTPTAQAALGEELRRRMLAVIAPPPPQGVPTPAVLLTVLAERRRRATLLRPSGPPTSSGADAGRPSRGQTGPPPQPPPGPVAPPGSGPFAPPS